MLQEIDGSPWDDVTTGGMELRNGKTKPVPQETTMNVGTFQPSLSTVQHSRLNGAADKKTSFASLSLGASKHTSLRSTSSISSMRKVKLAELASLETERKFEKQFARLEEERTASNLYHKRQQEELQRLAKIEATKAAIRALDDDEDGIQENSVLSSLPKIEPVKELFLQRRRQEECCHRQQQEDQQHRVDLQHRADTEEAERVYAPQLVTESEPLRKNENSSAFRDPRVRVNSDLIDFEDNTRFTSFNNPNQESSPLSAVDTLLGQHYELPMQQHQNRLKKEAPGGFERVQLGHGHHLDRDSGRELAFGTELAKTFIDAMAATRVPVPKPCIFNGDPLLYPSWIAAFSHLVENTAVKAEDKMLVLKDFLEGPARDAVEDLYFDLSEASYQHALSILRERFGQDYAVAEAVKRRLAGWPVIKENDFTTLRAFTDYLRQCIAMLPRIEGLQILEDPSQLRLLVCKLPESQRCSWHSTAVRHMQEHGTYPGLRILVNFLNLRCKALSEEELCRRSLNTKTNLTGSAPHPRRVYQTGLEQTDDVTTDVGSPAAVVLYSNGPAKVDSKKCPFCEGAHVIEDCGLLMKSTFKDRRDFARKRGLCFRCLQVGHTARGCLSRVVCKNCKGKHVTAMHDPDFTPRPNPQQATGGGDGQHSGQANRVYRVKQQLSSGLYTLFLPVFVSCENDPDHEVLVYAMLDTMSDASFIDADVLGQLDIPRWRTSLTLRTLTSERARKDCWACKDLIVRAWNSNDMVRVNMAYSHDALETERNQIPTREVVSSIPHLKHLAGQFSRLKDVPVGLLLGADVSEALRPLEIVSGESDQPYAIRTKLGWSMVGTVMKEDDAYGKPFDAPEAVCFRTKDHTTEKLVAAMDKEFADTVDGKTSRSSQEDMRFLSIMDQETEVNDEGHYQMPLPFKEDSPYMPNNRDMALRRLISLRRRFLKDHRHHELYTDFMRNLIADGNAEKVPEHESNVKTIWYIPHHGVYNSKKPGKVRVVFDCAASFQGSSLNDLLLTGPDQMNSLMGVLCRFRLNLVAITCDIQQMFHQFHVAPHHRDYLRFLWWPEGDLNKKPVDFRMKVHLFGATSSPGCANYALKRLARDHSELHAQASQFISRDFYVDDGLASTATSHEAVDLLNGTREICRQGGLRLHKIASNSSQVLASFPETEVVQFSKNLEMDSRGPGNVERALGIHWNLKTDILHFAGDRSKMATTRRGVLAVVASVFDPLGLVSPVVLRGRQVLQQACKEGLGWDEQLTSPLLERWRRWVEDLRSLANVQIPRCYFKIAVNTRDTLEFHHFSDASFSGYGECSYIRTIDASGNPHHALVVAKAKVAPVRQVTVPRLELQAAVLAVKTARFLDQEFRGYNVQHRFWTDSMVVLGYIYNQSKRFHIFVANRLQQILDFSKPEQWGYVPSDQNPADKTSRGMSVKELENSTWRYGPEFLSQRSIPFTNPNAEVGDDDKEVRSYQVLLVEKTENGEGEDPQAMERDWDVERFCQRFSSLRRLQRVLCMVRISVRRKTWRGVSRLITLDDEDKSLMMLVKKLQDAHYPGRLCQGHKDVKLLSPFRDASGLLRVGGRLKYAGLKDKAKHPLIIPGGCHLSRLLALHHHRLIGHQGRTSTLGALQLEGYWICGARRTVSAVIRDCVFCTRLRRAPMGQKMADLPQERMEPAPPFTHSGMDCFGPFTVRRGRSEVKRYGLILTCLASRAVHLEVLEDMSTDAFINALRRFIAMRGNVQTIRSDRGTNFVGADAELRRAWKDIERERVLNGLAQKGCEFSFNPPVASHFGGAWERLIRTARQILIALLKDYGQHLTSDALVTLFCEAAAIMNNRPLCVNQLGDPDACEPLTPNHLLTLRPQPLSAPPGVFERRDLYVRKRWRRVQYLADQFWARWKKEFLLSMQPRRKWYQEQDAVSKGMVVLLADDSTTRGSWKLGRVTEVYLSHDGRVRSVQLKTASARRDRHGKWSSVVSLLERPVHKLIPLRVET